MDDCQHYPVRITREPRGATATAVIRCERCKIETNPIVWSGNQQDVSQLWNEWAQLMAKESDGRRAWLEKEALCAPRPTPEEARMARDADCWRQFMGAAGVPSSRPVTSRDAQFMGANYREAAAIEEVLRRHLKAPVTPQRLTDILVVFRKATRAFHMWGVLETPKE